MITENMTQRCTKLKKNSINIMEDIVFYENIRIRFWFKNSGCSSF